MDVGDVELPYAAEYAKSGRANCKGCKTPIPKDALRLAAMVQVRTGPYKIPKDCVLFQHVIINK